MSSSDEGDVSVADLLRKRGAGTPSATATPGATAAAAGKAAALEQVAERRRRASARARGVPLVGAAAAPGNDAAATGRKRKRRRSDDADVEEDEDGSDEDGGSLGHGRARAGYFPPSSPPRRDPRSMTQLLRSSPGSSARVPLSRYTGEGAAEREERRTPASGRKRGARRSGSGSGSGSGSEADHDDLADFIADDDENDDEEGEEHEEEEEQKGTSRSKGNCATSGRARASSAREAPTRRSRQRERAERPRKRARRRSDSEESGDGDDDDDEDEEDEGGDDDGDGGGMFSHAALDLRRDEEEEEEAADEGLGILEAARMSHVAPLKPQQAFDFYCRYLVAALVLPDGGDSVLRDRPRCPDGVMWRKVHKQIEAPLALRARSLAASEVWRGVPQSAISCLPFAESVKPRNEDEGACEVCRRTRHQWAYQVRRHSAAGPVLQRHMMPSLTVAPSPHSAPADEVLRAHGGLRGTAGGAAHARRARPLVARCHPARQHTVV
jgi:hypothetical protein